MSYESSNSNVGILSESISFDLISPISISVNTFYRLV